MEIRNNVITATSIAGKGPTIWERTEIGYKQNIRKLVVHTKSK